MGTAVSFLALTYVSVGLRTYVRTFLTKGFLLDDWLMLVSQVRQHNHEWIILRREIIMLTTADRRSSPFLAPSYYLVSRPAWEDTTRRCLRAKRYKQ